MIALVVFGYFTISHTTHLYGMLALTAISRNERAVYGWWRKRFMVDVLVTAVALGLSVFH
jgi:hypothetical protein